ncbi:MAG TPA: hypothetical protein VK338_00935, partial [Candidatus Nitrosocosmicus sp.]|nr:hypothetical protein [Candidatus Nitrosocosmicus sp.]
MQQQYRRSPRRNFSNNRNNNNSNKRFAAVAMPINELEKAINSFQKNKIINEMEPEKSYISTNSFDSLPISGFL